MGGSVTSSAPQTTFWTWKGNYSYDSQNCAAAETHREQQIDTEVCRCDKNPLVTESRRGGDNTQRSQQVCSLLGRRCEVWSFVFPCSVCDISYSFSILFWVFFFCNLKYLMPTQNKAGNNKTIFPHESKSPPKKHLTNLKNITEVFMLDWNVKVWSDFKTLELDVELSVESIYHSPYFW